MRRKQDLLKGRVLKLREDAELNHGLKFHKGQEFELVQGVVYMEGYPFPPNVQGIIKSWIDNNPDLFNDETRTW